MVETLEAAKMSARGTPCGDEGGVNGPYHQSVASTLARARRRASRRAPSAHANPNRTTLVTHASRGGSHTKHPTAASPAAVSSPETAVRHQGHDHTTRV